MQCSVNLVVFVCGAVQHADKACGHGAAGGCIFLLSAPSLLQTIRPTVVLAGRTKLRVSKNFLSRDIFLCLLNIFATAAPKSKQKIPKIIVQF